MDSITGASEKHLEGTKHQVFLLTCLSHHTVGHPVLPSSQRSPSRRSRYPGFARAVADAAARCTPLKHSRADWCWSRNSTARIHAQSFQIPPHEKNAGCEVLFLNLGREPQVTILEKSPTSQATEPGHVRQAPLLTTHTNPMQNET